MWTWKYHNKVCQDIFKRGLFFLCVFLGSLFASEGDVDNILDEAVFAEKKIKLQDGTCVLSEDVDERLLKKIIAAGDVGCRAQAIEDFLPACRCGPMAVLEAVVRVMFKKSVVIEHDNDESRFLYKGPAPSNPNAPNIMLAIARYIIDHPRNTNIQIPKVGYAVLQQGCYTSSYPIFWRLYHAVLCVCQMGTTEQDIRVQSFLHFIQKTQTEDEMSFYDFVEKYKESDVNLNPREQWIAKCAFSFPKNIRDDIEAMKKDAEMCRTQRCAVLCQGKVLGWVSDEFFCGNTSSHIALVMAEVMQAREITDFAKVCDADKLLSRGCSREDLQKAYNAVCVICYEGQTILKKQVREFFDYVQQKQWLDRTTFLEQKCDYCQENKGPFDNRLWDTAGYIRSLPEDVWKKLQDIKIPVKQHYSWRRKEATAHELFLEMRRRAEDGTPHSMASIAEFVPSRWKGKLDVLRNILDIAFQNKMALSYDEENDVLSFFVFYGKEEPYVPKEVLIAARFLGTTCHSKDKVHFAITMHNMGYPMVSYDDFSDSFDAVCVVGHLPVVGIPYVKKAQGLFAYMKKDTQQRSLQELLEGYKAQERVDEKTLMIAMSALSIEKGGLLASWQVLRNTPKDERKGVASDAMLAWQVVDGLIIRIVREYTQKRKHCPYQVLNAFLPHCYSAHEVACVVLRVAVRNHIRVIYDKTSQGFLLNEEPLWPTPYSPISAFVLEKVCQDAMLDSIELAYDAHNAGYRPEDLREIADLRAGYIKSGLDGGQYGPQQTLCPAEDVGLQGLFVKENSDTNAFGRKKVLPRRGKRENPKMLKDAESDVVQTDLSQEKVMDFNSLVRDAIKADAVVAYQKIMPYVNGATTPEAVLEFVMDFVFKKGVCVERDDAGENYKFLNKRYDGKGLAREEVLMRFMQGRYVHRACTVRDRAECAYAMHVKGAKYASFKDFAQDFGAVCLVQNIDVQGMEDIARNKKHWDDTTTNFDCNGRDMLEKALHMSIFA